VDDITSNASAASEKAAPKSQAKEVKQFLCSPKTAMSCAAWHGFGGDAECQKLGTATCDKNSMCVCEPGSCADGHGKCGKKGKLLPGAFTVEVHEDGKSARYVHMHPDSKELDFSMEEPGRNGHWHMIVNSDNSVMLYTKEFGFDHFMTVIESGNEMRNEYTSFASPRESSFEIYKDEKQLVYLKDIVTGLWLQSSRRLGGNSIKGVHKFPGPSGGLIFHPPLKESDVKMMTASAHCLWPLLPLLLLGLSLFG